jgi:translation initiation factor IF-3
MIMVLGPHKKKTEAMAEAREAQAARKAEAKANPGKSQNAAESEFDGEDIVDEVETVEAPAEASADA